MKKFISLTTALFLLAAAMCGLGGLCASANSAQTWFEGSDASGLVVSGEESPIEVEREVLTFDIPELPAAFYPTMQEYYAYDSKVTAEYSLYNPTDQTITTRLLFPFGNLPTYLDFLTEDGKGNTIVAENARRHDITVNGEAIDKKLRHSFSYESRSFSLETDLARLSDGFAEDPFYSPETPVTKYTYRISGVDTDAYPNAEAVFYLESDNGSTVYYFPDINMNVPLPTGRFRAGTWATNRTFEFWAIGKPLVSPQEGEVCMTDQYGTYVPVDGQVTLESADTMTFREFALAGWNEEDGVTEIDWYNAFLAQIRENSSVEEEMPFIYIERYGERLRPMLMQWYEYELTLGPGERMVNTVTAPLYPSIDEKRSATEYRFVYLLSPAKTWGGFGGLEIRINTPYFLGQNGDFDFTQVEDGYKCTLDGLPDEELIFSLYSEEYAPAEGGSVMGSSFLLFSLIASAILALAGAIAAVIIVCTVKRS